MSMTKLGKLDLAESVSAHTPLAEARQAVKALDSKEGNPIRLVLVP